MGTDGFFLFEIIINVLGGHNSISGGGGWSFCRGQIIYFNRARRRAENFKFYYIFI